MFNHLIVSAVLATWSLPPHITPLELDILDSVRLSYKKVGRTLTPKEEAEHLRDIRRKLKKSIDQGSVIK